MVDKISFYLKNEDQIEKIAEQGYMEAFAKHTYLKRAEYIRDIFSLYSPMNSNEAIDRKMIHTAKQESFLLFLKVYCMEYIIIIKKRVKQYIKRMNIFRKHFDTIV